MRDTIGTRRRILRPEQLPAPRGYSHGVVAHGSAHIFVAGQSGRGTDGALPDDIVAQARQALTNVQTVLAAGGGRMTDVTRLGVQVTDMTAYLARPVELAALFRAFFPDGLPAMSLCEVSRFMDPAVFIELDAIAVLPGDPHG